MCDPAERGYIRAESCLWHIIRVRLHISVILLCKSLLRHCGNDWGSHLRQLLLFGSRARGDAQDGSDYDMLVVVDHHTPELRAVILEVESQLMERYGALVATVLRSETEWQQLQGFPLARNIAREGVPL